MTLTRAPEATHPAVVRHFAREFGRYNSQFIVNLLGSRDKEKLLSDAYKKQVQWLNEVKKKRVKTIKLRHACTRKI